MLLLCNRCGHFCKPSQVDGYTYECRHCDEDLYDFEVTKYRDEACEKVYIDWFNDYLTIPKMAMDYRMPRRVMNFIVNRGRVVHCRKFDNK